MWSLVIISIHYYYYYYYYYAIISYVMTDQYYYYILIITNLIVTIIVFSFAIVMFSVCNYHSLSSLFVCLFVFLQLCAPAIYP
jgi:hypothetical protein